jgi:hypothetical protein
MCHRYESCVITDINKDIHLKDIMFTLLNGWICHSEIVEVKLWKYVLKFKNGYHF